MRHQYPAKKPNQPLNLLGALNAKKLALLTLLTSTGMTMLVHHLATCHTPRSNALFHPICFGKTSYLYTLPL